MKKIYSNKFFELDFAADEEGNYFLLDTSFSIPQVIESDRDLQKLGKKAFELKYDHACERGKISDNHILITSRKRKDEGSAPHTMYMPLDVDWTTALIELLFVDEYASDTPPELLIVGGDIPVAYCVPVDLFIQESDIYTFISLDEDSRNI